MAILNVNKAVTSNMTDNVPDITVDTQTTDAPEGQENAEWQTKTWAENHGYYRQIPECKIATDTLVRWTIGDGFIAQDAETEIVLDHISGSGIDTFDDILENMYRTARIDGDAYAEVMRDESSGKLLNLKPLDPSSIKVIYDKKGIIKEYQQVSKTEKGKKIVFKPREIFHLCNNRIADEMHGISDYTALKKIILANFESFEDFQTVVHRNVVPVRIIEVDTDDATKIAQIKSQYETLIKNKEVIVIPKGTVSVTDAGLSGNATFNPLPWREHLKNYFYQVCGIPQILMGSSGEFTDSTAKIALISFQQVCRQNQRYLITQIWNQLFIKIDLPESVNIQNEMISQTQKNGVREQGGITPGELQAGVNQ